MPSCFLFSYIGAVTHTLSNKSRQLELCGLCHKRSSSLHLVFCRCLLGESGDSPLQSATWDCQESLESQMGSHTVGLGVTPAKVPVVLTILAEAVTLVMKSSMLLSISVQLSDGPSHSYNLTKIQCTGLRSTRPTNIATWNCNELLFWSTILSWQRGGLLQEQ